MAQNVSSLLLFHKHFFSFGPSSLDPNFYFPQIHTHEKNTWCGKSCILSLIFKNGGDLIFGPSCLAHYFVWWLILCGVWKEVIHYECNIIIFTQYQIIFNQCDFRKSWTFIWKWRFTKFQRDLLSVAFWSRLL